MRRFVRWGGVLSGFFCAIFIVFNSAQATTLSTKQFIQVIHIAYWGRAADPQSLIYWQGRYDAGTVDLAGIADNMAASDEGMDASAYFDTLFNHPGDLSNRMHEDFIASVCLNLLGRAPDEAELRDWIGILKSGETGPGAFITTIVNAAYIGWQGYRADDWDNLNAKIQVAEYYTDVFIRGEINWTAEEHLGLAADALSGIDKDADIATAMLRINQALDDMALNQGLVAHYPFDGDAGDESGNGRDGRVNGATLVEDHLGHANAAYFFCQKDDYVITDSSTLDISDQFTAALWVKITSTTGLIAGSVIPNGVYDEPFWFSTRNGRIAFSLMGENEESLRLTGSITMDSWVFVTGVFDTGVARLYINGQLVDEQTAGFNALNGKKESIRTLYGNQNPITRGDASGQEDLDLFAGAIDDVRLYNRALSEAEIEKLFQPAVRTNMQTMKQTVYGNVLGREDHAGTLAWLGVPYAKPPVGSLRWKAPEKPDRWEGTRNTTAFCDACPQYENTVDIIGNEDCLYLNIWRPQTPDNDLPVYVYIHGGGNVGGTAGEAEYSGANLAHAADMVVVTLNYRLGPLGWFAHPALRTGLAGDEHDDSGNFGLLDIIRALEWVHDNIEIFGGDPDNVIIAGHSAGAYNVFSLLISNQASGLFHKAITMGGMQQIYTLAEGEQDAERVIRELLIDDGSAADPSEAASYLADMPATEIASYLRSTAVGDLLACYSPSAFGLFSIPQLFTDGSVLPARGYKVFEDGTYPSKVPIILGTNLDELKLSLRYHDLFYPVIEDESFWSDQAAQDLFAAAGKYGSDLWKVGGVDDMARKLSADAAQPPVYAYRFDWGSGAEIGGSVPEWYQTLLGACHGVEVPFFFGNDTGTLSSMLYHEDNRLGRETLSGAMMSYVGRFAHTGDPNGAGLPDWGSWSNTPGEDKFLVLNVDEASQALACQMSSEELTRAGVLEAMMTLPEPTYTDLMELFTQLFYYMEDWESASDRNRGRPAAP